MACRLVYPAFDGEAFKVLAIDADRLRKTEFVTPAIDRGMQFCQDERSFGDMDADFYFVVHLKNAVIGVADKLSPQLVVLYHLVQIAAAGILQALEGESAFLTGFLHVGCGFLTGMQGLDLLRWRGR